MKNHVEMEDSKPTSSGELETNRKKRGTLKIYLGMAAGVGKTYSMLSDAKIDLDRGVDVVSGYIEPHGRVETDLLSDKIPSLPLWEGEQNGVKFRDFDLNLALKRKPEIILIDELAHTNPLKSRHTKRYLDILELLEAGINVRSTLNVQHLESVKDIVENITEIKIYESVPDKILLEADIIEVIDLPPAELIARLKEGKIYSTNKVELALQKFFQASNLNALREILLRLVADRVGKDVNAERIVFSPDKIIKTKERILVCIAPNAFSSQVVREGRRLATSVHGDFLAISVETPYYANLPAEIRTKSTETLKLAEDLGARVILKSSLDVVDEIIAIARENNITQIVLGKPPKKTFQDYFKKTAVDKILENSGEIGIFLVHTDLTEKPTSKKERIIEKSIYRRPKDLIMSLTTVAAFTAIAYPISTYFSNVDVVMIYLLATAWSSVFGGKFQSILVSFFSVLVFDFCFVEPYYTIRVSDQKNIITLFVMLGVGLTLNTLTSRLRSHAQIFSRREQRTASLYEFSRKLSLYESQKKIIEFLEKSIATSIGFEAKLILKDFKTDKNILQFDSLNLPDEKYYTLASWCFEHIKRVGKGTEILSATDSTYFPVSSSSGIIGVLIVFTKGQILDLDQEQLVETFCYNAAIAIERIEISKKVDESIVVAEKEKVRNAFLSSISHDLRTPLTSIEGAASSLLSSNIYEKYPELKNLAISIIDQSRRLSRLIGNILNITRLSSDKIDLKLEWHSLEEIIGCARRLLITQLKNRLVDCSFDSRLPLIFVDGTLFEQLFVNLLENITKYTPEDSSIVISSNKISNQWYEITLTDNGPGMIEDNKNVSSYKLGHLICKAIVEAHGGSIVFENLNNLGLKVKMQFPITKNMPEIEYE